MEIIIGSHVSFNSKEQLIASVKEALSYGANTFMFYTGAPQNTKRYEIDDSLTKEAKKLLEENHINIENVIVHAPYIINLANPTNYDFSTEKIATFISEALKKNNDCIKKEAIKTNERYFSNKRKQEKINGIIDNI